MALEKERLARNRADKNSPSKSRSKHVAAKSMISIE